MRIHCATASTDIFYAIPSGIKYYLQSFFYIPKKESYIVKMHSFNHIIIDSGLFTMMFGSKKGKFGKDALVEWTKSYVRFINNNPEKNVSFVEMDTQKLLGIEATWEIREQMKRECPDRQLINVYHLEDENPDRLINYASYIAISIPELRALVSEREMLNIIKYISTKATLKQKRVHLLGCAEEQLLKKFSYCFSADATSWMAPIQFNREISLYQKSADFYDLNKNILEIFNREKNPPRCTAVYYSAAIAKSTYQSLSGNQNA